MAIPDWLLEHLPPEYATLLREAGVTGDFTNVAARLEEAKTRDALMLPSAGTRGEKYLKPFAQTVVPKILEALKRACAKGTAPEIPITYQEIDETRTRIGIDSFGSPQDVLYTLSSERGASWGTTLDAMGFQSACMDGVGSVSVTMAPRFLSPGKPDFEITELRGAIGNDFWRASEVLFSEFPLGRNLEVLAESTGNTLRLESLLALPITEAKVAGILTLIDLMLDAGRLTAVQATLANLAKNRILSALPKPGDRFSPNRMAALLASARKRGDRIPQEQVALKYAEEGRFLQKLLDGARLEHFQSNVKMQANPLRNAKCEIDSIYTVGGEKHLVLVEAKGKDKVARTQLYQAYETFRLKIPLDWQLTVVAILMSPPSADDIAAKVETIIDLIEVGFDEAAFGQITRSVLGIRPKRHIRWKIVGQS